MIILLKYDDEYKKMNVKKSCCILDVLDKLNINREIVVPKKNGNIVTEFDVLNEKDKLQLIFVKSGG